MVCPCELEKLIFSWLTDRAKWMPFVDVFKKNMIADRDLRGENHNKKLHIFR